MQRQRLETGREAADGSATEGLVHEVHALLHLATAAEEDEDVPWHFGAMDVEHRIYSRMEVVTRGRLHRCTCCRISHRMRAAASADCRLCQPPRDLARYLHVHLQ